MNRVELDPQGGPGAEFGVFLRSSREQRGWTQDDLAKTTGYSSSHISAVETNRRPPTPRFSKKLDKAFGTDGVLTRKTNDVKNSPLLEGFAEYVVQEAKAVELRLFDLGIVPGLLQTQRYAEAIAAGAVRRGSITQDQADKRVEFVTARQLRLHRDQPPLLHVVMDESCVRRTVGGPAVMAAQLERLAEVSALPHTVLQVASFAIGEDRTFDLPVNILTLPNRSLMSYAESSQQGHLERDSDSVVPILTAYYQLQATALSPAESAALISSLRKELP
ncbi:Scr1 family TA system antitoxin-like transcriptional regulator [Kitasatospora sp. NPDC094019]|uniref:helix-turn-helix domain-containing protein n=1 Tax=Kitasatospora sp. NPDC094019 TaxID=3364091 RepID=UPI00381BF63D